MFKKRKYFEHTIRLYLVDKGIVDQRLVTDINILLDVDWTSGWIKRFSIPPFLKKNLTQHKTGQIVKHVPGYGVRLCHSVISVCINPK